MGQIKLTLPDDIHNALKSMAKHDERSLTNYLQLVLKRHVRSKMVPGSYYPEQVHSPIPEEPYKSTEKPKKRTIIGDDTSTTTSTTTSPSKKHPLLWLDENNISTEVCDPNYELLHKAYPDVTQNEFINYQHQRQTRYVPDANDPYDPMTNNPYNKK